MLPHSTGNDFRLLQTSNRRLHDESDIDQVLLDIPLEDRLDVGYRSSRVAESYNLQQDDGSNQSSPMLDPYIGPQLNRFLDSLALVLVSRPLSSTGADILHILAIAIHPAPVLDKGVLNNSHPAAARARRLASHMAAYQLHATNHRKRCIQLVHESVALPSFFEDDDNEAVGYTALMTGPLPHLLASLRARGGCDQTVVRLVAQTQNVQRFLQPEWDRLFHGVVDEGAAVCGPCCSIGQSGADSPCYCLSRGDCMAVLVERCLHIPDFRDLAVGSLSDAIEWQADSWKESKKDVTYPPCLLAALVRAASSVFRSSSRKPKDALATVVGISVQLLVHPSPLVVNEAAKLLLRYLVSGKATKVKTSAKAISSALQLCLHKEVGNGLVGILSSFSVEFSEEMMAYALDSIEAGKHPVLFRWLSAVAVNSPSSSKLHKDRLETYLTNHELLNDQKLHIAEALLSTRLSHYFAREVDLSAVARYASSLQDSWLLYKFGVSALVTGNHELASDSFLRLQELDLSEQHFMWTSVLYNVAQVGNLLAKNGAMGIPDALTSLASAIEYMDHVAFSPDWDGHGSFQKKFLIQYMDFLDLLTALRHIAREIRLSAQIPRKNTRTVAHLRNIPRSFRELRNRYRRLRVQYGATFRFSDSAGGLDVIADVCRFMEHATQAVFPDVFKPKQRGGKAPANQPFVCKGNHVLASLMRKLDTLLLEPMSTSVEPLVRAAAVIELIDGVIQAPFPFPRDFLLSSPEECATLVLSPDELQGTLHEDATLFAFPSVCFSFVASGRLPPSFDQRCRFPVRSVLLWFRLAFQHAPALTGDDDNPEEQEDTEAEPVQLPDWSACSPAQSAALLPKDRFYFQITCPPLTTEGMYTLEVKLGCLDVMGNKWEVPLDDKDRTFSLKVSRALENTF